MCVPVQLGIVIWSTFFVQLNELSTLGFVGLTISVGVCSGILGINVAHELIYRVKSRLEPHLGQILLSTCLYMHWGLEHVVGHHRTVATHKDPATARLNESFHRFLPRTIIGSLISALQFEVKRLKRRNLSPWSLKNRVVKYSLLQLAILIAVFLIRDEKALLFFLLQSFVAIGLLEIVNYIEHYGWLRKTVNEQLETPKPWHSWNSSSLLSNLFLFNLQRHSDHHFKPARRYHILRHFDDSPQLPTGYAGMIWLAAIPFQWKKIMNPRIESLQANVLSKLAENN